MQNFENGDRLYVPVTVANLNNKGNMLRVVTETDGVVLYLSKEELKGCVRRDECGTSSCY